MIINVDGLEVPVEVPEGAIVQHAVVTVAFQGFTEQGEPYAGTLWGSTPTPWHQVIGMNRVTQLDMESQAITK